MTAPRILIDLDGVVVDTLGLANNLGLFDHHPACRWDFHPCCTSATFDEVFAGHIFRDALPIHGAIHGVEALIGLGYDVQFASTPWPSNHQSAADKYAWVDQWFGPKSHRLLTLTHDKTLIPAAVLVDDKPGLIGPWRQVTYPQPWNDSDYPTWAEGLASVIVAIVGTEGFAA